MEQPAHVSTGPQRPGAVCSAACRCYSVRVQAFLRVTGPLVLLSMLALPAAAQQPAAPATATATGEPSAPAAERENTSGEPGEMTLQEATAYFKDLRRWHRQRYDRPFTLGIGAGFGYGIDSPGVNGYGASLGLSVGYTFPVYNAYLGLSAIHFFGDDVDPALEAGQDDPPSGAYSSNRVTLDYGYEFIFRHVRMRALLTGGGALFDTPEVILIVPTVGLGSTLMFPLGSMYVAGDARFDLQFGRDDLAAHSIETLVKLGLRF